jgi:hypothetical protein
LSSLTAAPGSWCSTRPWWSANPVGMLWPEMDGAFVASGDMYQSFRQSTNLDIGSTGLGMTHQSTEMNSIAGSEFQDIPNGDCRWLGRSNRIIQRRNRRRLQKLLEPGRREHEKVMVLDVAGIT